MFNCKDPLADLLKEYGYNLVALPKPDIEPLQILTKEGKRLEKIGHLKDLFKRGEEVPMPSKGKDIPAAKEIQSSKSCGVKADMGVKLLGNFLEGFGVKGADIGAALGNVDKIIFSFKDVLTSEISLINLDAFIHDAEMNEKAKSYINKLKNSEIFIITAVMKSRAFVTEMVSDNNVGVSVALPNVKGIVAGKIGVNFQNNQSNKLVYEGEDHRVFGFKAVRLIYDKKKEEFKIKNIDGVVLRGEEDFPTDNLLSEDNFVQL